jgi:hypothetical protein
MATNEREPGAGGSAPNWNLPEIVDIKVRVVPFRPREYKYFRSALADYKEAVEFLVRLNGPIPMRALGPALFVGDVQVSEAEAVDEYLYRFLAFDSKRFKRGAAIAWGWNNATKPERQPTNFRFEPAQ